MQAIKAENRQRAGRYYSKEFYLLTGLVFCAICGRRYQGNLRVSGKSRSRYVSYCCNAHRAECGNKEINQSFLDDYIVMLLRDKLFNAKAMHKCIDRLNHYIEQYNANYDANFSTLHSRHEALTLSLANITSAIEKDLLTTDVIQRAEKLETEKSQISSRLERMHRLNPVTYAQYEYLIDDFGAMQKKTMEFREFVRTYVQKILVYPYRLEIILRIGFDVTDELTEKVTIRRGNLYDLFQGR